LQVELILSFLFWTKAALSTNITSGRFWATTAAQPMSHLGNFRRSPSVRQDTSNRPGPIGKTQFGLAPLPQKIAQKRPNEVPHQEKRQSGDFKKYLNNLGQSGSRDFVNHSRNALCNSVTYIERVIAPLGFALWMRLTSVTTMAARPPRVGTVFSAGRPIAMPGRIGSS